jgi:hypothetical protein
MLERIRHVIPRPDVETAGGVHEMNARESSLHIVDHFDLWSHMATNAWNGNNVIVSCVVYSSASFWQLLQKLLKWK